MNYPVIYLKRGKEVPILKKHHWVFSGAVKKVPDTLMDGELCQVRSEDNKPLGFAYFNGNTSITCRMLSFGEQDPLEALTENIKSAINLRLELFKNKDTNAYRLINGEGDGISGLTVDKYNDVLVMQISTLGIEKLKEFIIDILVKEFKDVRIIFEKSNMPARRHEGMESSQGILWAKDEAQSDIKTVVKENGKKFEIDFENSHKTGFYLDQRNMRELIGDLSKGKNVLNCFSYTGGFSLYSAMNSAKSVTSVDISSEVIEQAKANFEINKLDSDSKKYDFVAEDVFEFIEQNDCDDYDIIILDPPAFAKKREDYDAACSGYRRLNGNTMRKMKPGSLLLTCSCSYHVDEESFLNVLNKAANDARRNVRIIGKHRMAEDHVINLFHKEMDYLKSFLLYIE